MGWDDGSEDAPEAVGYRRVDAARRTLSQVDRLTEGVRDRPGATHLYGEDHPDAGGYYALYCEGPARTTVEVVGPEG